VGGGGWEGTSLAITEERRKIWKNHKEILSVLRDSVTPSKKKKFQTAGVSRYMDVFLQNTYVRGK
jgi:hypothetical protein